jgi:serine/threonine-protein kinase HipA
VTDDNGHLWIAKFPSHHDDYDIAAWEYVAYKLALNAGVTMPESRIEKFGSHHHTFLTKRFDRTRESRLHFTSAMTQLGYYDGDYEASYLELAQFLTEHGANTKEDLAQLWRRIVFYIAISNTDDHLRNHGFIYHQGGWLLSPAYDINPVTPASGLHLNITDSDNRLDYNLAMEVIDFFQLDRRQAHKIKDEVLTNVAEWRLAASEIGLSRSEQQMMQPAFNL